MKEIVEAAVRAAGASGNQIAIIIAGNQQAAGSLPAQISPPPSPSQVDEFAAKEQEIAKLHDRVDLLQMTNNDLVRQLESIDPTQSVDASDLALKLDIAERKIRDYETTETKLQARIKSLEASDVLGETLSLKRELEAAQARLAELEASPARTGTSSNAGVYQTEDLVVWESIPVSSLGLTPELDIAAKKYGWKTSADLLNALLSDPPLYPRATKNDRIAAAEALLGKARSATTVVPGTAAPQQMLAEREAPEFEGDLSWAQRVSAAWRKQRQRDAALTDLKMMQEMGNSPDAFGAPAKEAVAETELLHDICEKQLMAMIYCCGLRVDPNNVDVGAALLAAGLAEDLHKEA